MSKAIILLVIAAGILALASIIRFGNAPSCNVGSTAALFTNCEVKR